MNDEHRRSLGTFTGGHTRPCVAGDEDAPGRTRGADRVCHAELLWQVLTAKRWELLKALCGAGRMSICEAARRVGRDVKAVHADVKALLDAGLINRTADGRIEFPFQAIKVEFVLQAA